jgi:hypothetical protein
MMPYDPTLYFADGTLMYDGSPAYYSMLRVRLSIPGTAAAWDYLATTQSWSVAGDYSSYLTQVPGTHVTPTPYLQTPEYSDVTIFGSDPDDGLCTYWENQLGKCPTLSSQVRGGETATCPAGQQKILITRIASDYPCNSTEINWCQGGQVQYVPDKQHWSITVEAMTENTTNFL